VRLGVENTDRDLEAAADNCQRVEPDLLRPYASRLLVDEVSDETTRGTEDDVQETEHSGPSSGSSLAELREVMKVVSTEDGVDGELGTE
jgi:hypothetical protein